VVYSLAVFENGSTGGNDLLAGGFFDVAGGLSSRCIAEWEGCAGRGIEFCFGDGSSAPCPCGNTGSSGRGCDNSATTGGALLNGVGTPSLSADTLVLTSSGERATAFSLFLQGSLAVGPLTYGDGLRCVGGTLKRLYTRNAASGVVSAPQGTEASISTRSLVLGDPIPIGGIRYYQVYYRDPSPTFCPDPPGNSWNISNARSVIWGQ